MIAFLSLHGIVGQKQHGTRTGQSPCIEKQLIKPIPHTLGHQNRHDHLNQHNDGASFASCYSVPSLAKLPPPIEEKSQDLFP